MSRPGNLPTLFVRMLDARAEYLVSGTTGPFLDEILGQVYDDATDKERAEIVEWRKVHTRSTAPDLESDERHFKSGAIMSVRALVAGEKWDPRQLAEWRRTQHAT